MSRKSPSSRVSFVRFSTISTRWSDNDIYGHMNNAIHYQLFDTAVNGYLLEHGALNFTDSPNVFLVVETSCTYFKELKFPDLVDCGLRVERIGQSSVQYAVGLFQGDAEFCSAEGKFVHVNVDRTTRKPLILSNNDRTVLQKLHVSI